MKRNEIAGIKTALILLTVFSFVALTVMTVQAQQPENFFFELKLHTTRETEWTELFIAQFAEIGIKLTIEIVDGPTQWARNEEGGVSGKTFDEGGFDMSFFGWGIDTVDPSGLTPMFHTSSKSPAGDNFIRFFNGELDTALTTGNEMLADWSEREPYYWRVQEILYEEVPYLPLYYGEPVNLLSHDLIYTDPFASGAGTGTATPTDDYGPVNVWPGDWYYWGIRFMAREGKTYEDETTVVIAESGDPQRFNPVLAPLSASYNSHVQMPMYDALVWNHNGFIKWKEWRGNLAESWDISDDLLTYTFYLREDVKWHDGVPFTSADILTTFNAYMDPDTAAWGTGPIGELVESVEALDDYTVVFHMKKHSPIVFETVFEHLVVPAHIWEDIPHSEWATSDYNTGLETPIGTGPYKFVEWIRGDHVRFERYEDYHLMPIFFDNYISKIYTDPETARMAIQTGELDYRGGNWEDRDLAIANPDTLKYTGGRAFYARVLVFNNDHPILSNKYVRKAINTAMPRDHMVDDLSRGVGTVANQFIVPGDPGHNPNLAPFEYSIDKAKEYMEMAGYNYDWLIPPEEVIVDTNAWITPAIGGVVVGAVIGAILLNVLGKK